MREYYRAIDLYIDTHDGMFVCVTARRVCSYTLRTAVRVEIADATEVPAHYTENLSVTDRFRVILTMPTSCTGIFWQMTLFVSMRTLRRLQEA